LTTKTMKPVFMIRNVSNETNVYSIEETPVIATEGRMSMDFTYNKWLREIEEI